MTQPSPLEKRLKTAGIAYVADWRLLHDRYSDVFGSTRGWGCGTAPPIFSIRSILQDYCDASTDEELRTFVDVLQNGDDAAKAKAVDDAAEKGLRYMSEHL